MKALPSVDLVLGLILWPLAVGAGDILARENVVAWCMVAFDAKKHGPTERAVKLQRHGYDGPIGIIDHREDTDSERMLSENREGLEKLHEASGDRH